MSTRTQLIDATAELLWERGYSATSPAMIQKRAHAGQGSMYHHFTGKVELAATAMSHTAQTMRAEVLAATAAESTALGKLRAYLAMERRPLLGCRLGRLVQDPEVIAEETLRAAAAEFFGWLRGWAEQALDEGRRGGELRADFDPAQLAAVLVAGVQGGYVLTRAEGAERDYQLVIAGLNHLLTSLAAA